MDGIWRMYYRSSFFLRALTEGEDFIPASQDQRFHHEFGRDTMINAQFIAKAKQFDHHTERAEKDLEVLWQRAKGAVFNFWEYQLPTGQLPHEVKPYNEKDGNNPFFHRVGKNLVNDDSVDATAFSLMVLPEFIEGEEELEMFRPRVERAFKWIENNMNTPGYNGWLCYKYNDHNGGHISQGLLDAHDVVTYGVTSDKKNRPLAPIALLDAQGYAWRAFRVWADKLGEIDPQKSSELRRCADNLKRRFNEKFVMEDEGGLYLARALNGREDRIEVITIEPGMALWASHNGESIIEDKYIPHVVARLLSPSMFDETAGIRVFENGQETYKNHEWYQTGDDQYWSVLTAMAASGMYELGYKDEARRAMVANILALQEYGSFAEHFIKNGVYLPLFEKGENSINQTWTATSVLYTTALLLNPRAFI